MTDHRRRETIEVPEGAETYPDGRIDAGAVLSLFTPLVRELGVPVDTTAFLKRLYDVDVLAPVYVGECLEVVAEVTSEEELAVYMAFTASKPVPGATEGAPVITVLRARALYVTPKTF